MLHALLLTFLSSGSGHAPLHPADADLYLDLPAAKELLAARGRSPWNRLFADQEMKQFYSLLEGLGVPAQTIGEAAFPAELLSEHGPLQSLLHASFSVSGLDDVAIGGAAHLRLSGVLDFSDEAAASAALLALEGSKALSRVEDGTLAKECKLGDHACPLTWYQSEANESFAPLARFGRGAAEQAASAANSRLWIAREGSRLHVGALESTPEALAARVAGAQPGLPEEARLFAGVEVMSPPSGTAIYSLWCDLDLHGLLAAPEAKEFDIAARWLLPVLMPYVGAKGIWRVEMRGDRFVTEAVYQRHPSFDNRSLGIARVDPAAARFVPKEAVGAWLTSLDAKAIEGEVRRLVAPLLERPAGSESDGTVDVEARRKELDALPSLANGLGTGAAFYLLPINSIQTVLPRAFLAVQLKDKAAFESALDAWASRLAELAPQAKVTSKPYRKQTLVSMAIGKEELEQAPAQGGLMGGLAPDFSLSPAIVVLEDRVLFTIKRSYAQAETRRIVDAKSVEAHPIAAPGRIPEGVFEASTMDWGGFFGKLLDVVKGLVPMAAGMMGEGAPQIDAGALPGSATLARYFQPTNSWSRRLDDGRIHTWSESSFGPETPTGIVAFASAAAGAFSKGAVLRPPASAEPALAAEPVEPTQPALETKAALLAVKTGIAVYRSQAGRAPTHLAELLGPLENFPDGCLAPRKELPKDGWQHELAYKPEPDGKKFLLYSLGPDGKDDGGTGDDVRAP